ncbi:unnamed protein product [Sphagnum balticum]
MAMGEVLREFGVKVSLNFDGKKIDEAESKIKKFGSEMRTFALEVAGVTAGLFATGKSFTGFSRSVVDQAQGLNITTDALQEYEYAAGIAADATREDVVDAFKNLGDTLDKARAGVPEAAQALIKMGEAGGKSAEIMAMIQNPLTKVSDVAMTLSEGIKNMSVNNPLAARRMTELAYGSDKLYNLWRQGPDAIKALNKEADKNSVVNKNMLLAGKKMDQQLTKLWFIFRKFGLEIGAKIMPHVMKLVGQFEKWFQANKKMISSGIDTFLDSLANAIEVVGDDVESLMKALVPVVNAIGGAKNAINLLIAAFLAWKALSLTASFIEMSASIFKVVGPMLQLGRVFTGLGEAFKAFSLIEGVADILPALELFGTGALAALSPLIPVMLAIGAATVGIHDLFTIISGGSFKDTWTGKGWEKIKQGVGYVGDKVKGLNFGTSAPYGQVPPAGGAAAASASQPVVTQEINHHNEINVYAGSNAKTPELVNGSSQYSPTGTPIPLAVLDIVKEESVDYDADVTEHPVESGPEVTDHIQLLNPTIRLKGTISNTPLDLSVAIANIAAGATIAVQSTSSQARSNLLNSGLSQGVGILGSALQGNAGNIASSGLAGSVDAISRTILLYVFQAKTPFTLVTRRQTYPNVVIKKLRFPRNEETGYALDFEMDIKQLTIVNPSQVSKTQLAEDQIPGGSSSTNLGSAWFLTLADQNRNMLVAPVPIVVNWPLFDRFIDLVDLPGTIFAFDTSGNNKDPGQFDLGNTVRLYYLEAGST